MAPMFCSSCGSNKIETDDLNGHIHVVCTSCGHIFEQGSYYDKEDQTEGTYNYCPQSGPTTTVHSSAIKSYLQAGNVGKNSQDLSVAALKWVKYTKMTCSTLGLPNSVTKNAVELFERAFQHPRFHHRGTERKHALVGACIFAVCKQSLWSILISNVASAVQCTVSDINGLFNLIVKEFSLQVPILMDMDSLIPSILNKYGIHDETIHAKTIRICSLAKETLVASGKHHEPVVLAAAYFAIRSTSNPKLKCKPFVRALNGAPTLTYKRVKELTEEILKLARNIPWLPHKHLNAEGIHHMLDDVLEHKNMLLSKCHNGNNEALDSCSLNDFMPPSQKDATCSPNPYDNDSNESELHELATSETLCELDIPESELHMYIRSPEEVAEIEKVKSELELEEDVAMDKKGAKKNGESASGESASIIAGSSQSNVERSEAKSSETLSVKETVILSGNLSRKGTTSNIGNSKKNVRKISKSKKRKGRQSTFVNAGAERVSEDKPPLPYFRKRKSTRQESAQRAKREAAKANGINAEVTTPKYARKRTSTRKECAKRAKQQEINKNKSASKESPPRLPRKRKSTRQESVPKAKQSTLVTTTEENTSKRPRRRRVHVKTQLSSPTEVKAIELKKGRKQRNRQMQNRR